MIIIIIYLILSFLLDIIVSLYTPASITSINYFITIYSIVSLVITYHYFENYKKYYIILIIMGILFDILFTNTFILNIFIFIIISLILKNLDYIIPNNAFTINIKSLISIYTYHIITYLLLLITHYQAYPISILLSVLIKSTIMTIIYTTISYLLIKKIYWHNFDRKIK